VFSSSFIRYFKPGRHFALQIPGLANLNRYAVGQLVLFIFAAAVGLTAAPNQGVAGDAVTLSEKLVPSQGALFGIFAAERSGRTGPEEVAYLEQKIGHGFDIDKEYYRWEKNFPGRHETAAVAAGRIPLVNWTAGRTDGTFTPWAAIANGSHDPTIRARADAVKAFGSKIFLVFNHEPEDDGRFGTASDFRAAHQRIVTVFRERGVDNVVWVLNLMAYTFNPKSGRDPLDWYPGDSYVDWIAADGYNWYGSEHVKGQSWRSFKSIFTPFYEWAKTRGKPLMVAEYGTLEDPADPNRKAQWFNEADAAVKEWPQMKAVVHFNGLGWWFDSSVRATQAFAEWSRTAASSAVTSPAPAPAPAPSPSTSPSPSPSPPPPSDDTKPAVRVTSPVDESSVAYREVLTIAAEASDATGVTKVELWANGMLRCTETEAPYTCDWRVWTKSGTRNHIRATAYDAAGNSASHVVNVHTS